MLFHLAVDRIKGGLKYTAVFSLLSSKLRAKSTPLNLAELYKN